MSANTNHPHGECECRDGCQCERNPGPAAFVVTRNGKDVKVCTKCDLSSDRATKRSLFTMETPLEPYRRWDALGAFCIAMRAALDGSEP